MFLKVLKIFVPIASILMIIFVFVFTFSFYFGWNAAIHKWINLKLYGYHEGYSPVQFQIGFILDLFFLALLPATVYFIIKKRWIGYLGLLAVLLYIYHFYFWSKLN